jgi:hypothetical protein
VSGFYTKHARPAWAAFVWFVAGVVWTIYTLRLEETT